MKRITLIVVLSLSLIVLAACGGTSEAEVDILQVEVAQVEAAQRAAQRAVQVEESALESPAVAEPGETLVDEQGAVVVAVTPRTFYPGASTVDFEVVMNTHSVDLSMDLTALATLTTDSGAQIVASGWDAPEGGHHVSGLLSFPAVSDGNNLLEGATTLTLTLENVDTPVRTFTWSLK